MCHHFQASIKWLTDASEMPLNLLENCSFSAEHPSRRNRYRSLGEQIRKGPLLQLATWSL